MANLYPDKFGLNNRSIRYWMDPDGKIFAVLYPLNHPKWAEMYLKHFNITVSNHPSDQLYKMGWIRLFDGVSVLHYENQYKDPTDLQMRKLKDFARMNNIGYLNSKKKR